MHYDILFVFMQQEKAIKRIRLKLNVAHFQCEHIKGEIYNECKIVN